MAPENTTLLVEVARLYYDHQLSQQQIADKVGVSRPAVSRLLNQARTQGIVRIEIIDPTNTGIELETALQARFGLKKVIVVPAGDGDVGQIKTRIGHASARYLDEIIRDSVTLGISWGTTMREVARHITARSVRDMTVVQIIGGLSRSQRDTHASESALRLGEKFQAVPYLLPVPAIVDSAALKRTITSDKNISRVLELGRKAEIALFSVGTFDHNSVMVQAEYFTPEEVDGLREQGAVGDICSHLVNANGEIVSQDLDDRTIGIELAELAQKDVAIAVAGGLEKLPVILSGLRGKYFNVLITDENVARRLVSE